MTNMSIKDPKEALRCHTLATTHQLDSGCSNSKLGGGFKYFLFSPRSLGKIPILTNIFQMGWNHQLVNIHLHTVVLFVSLLSVCVNLSVCVWGGGRAANPHKIPWDTSHSKMTWSFLIFLERKNICPFFIGNPLWTYMGISPLKGSDRGGVNS